MDQKNPPRRPLMRAVSFEEADAAIARLLDIARCDTGQSQRAADFRLDTMAAIRCHDPALERP